MARLGKREAEKAADELADNLDILSVAAIESQAGKDNDGASSVNEVVNQGINLGASEKLKMPLAGAIESAGEAPTVRDQGAGDGPLHPDFLKRLGERGYPASGATGDNLVVEIFVDEDGGDTLKVHLK